MPKRTTANKLQRELFEDISRMNKLALTTKVTDSLSINIHGAFSLFDKFWLTAPDNKHETMLAMKEKGLAKTKGEPAVHFHVDWNEIKWACIRPRYLELINTHYEIIFSCERNSASRKFWFYLRDGIDAQIFIAKWGSDWINLDEKYSAKRKFISYKRQNNSQLQYQTIN